MKEDEVEEGKKKRIQEVDEENSCFPKAEFKTEVRKFDWRGTNTAQSYPKSWAEVTRGTSYSTWSNTPMERYPSTSSWANIQTEEYPSSNFYKNTSRMEETPKINEDLFTSHEEFIFKMTSKNIFDVLDSMRWNDNTPLYSDWKDSWAVGRFYHRMKSWEKMLVENEITNYELSVIILLSFLSKDMNEALNYLRHCSNLEWYDSVSRFFTVRVSDEVNMKDKITDSLCIRSIPIFYCAESAMLWNLLTRSKYKTVDNFLQNSWAASLMLNDELLYRQMKLEKATWNTNLIDSPGKMFPLNYWVWRASKLKALFLADEAYFEYHDSFISKDLLVNYFRVQGQPPPGHVATPDPKVDEEAGEEEEENVDLMTQEDKVEEATSSSINETNDSNDFLYESMDSILSKANIF
jgi:hypothetical protein